MARFVYRDPERAAPEVSYLGITFFHGVATDVGEDAGTLEALDAHPYFERVEDDHADEEPLMAPNAVSPSRRKRA
jgi:hypothetical protein